MFVPSLLSRSLGRAFVFAALCLAYVAVAPAWAEQIVYLSPTGNDSNNGLSAERPIRSLLRAQEVATAAVAPGPDDVTIRVAPGTYLDQAVNWKLAVPGRAIKIIGNPVHPETVVFDGGKTGATFFRLMQRSGTPSNLSISGITITHYVMAITLNGNRDKLGGYNAGTQITHNRFIDNGGFAHDPPVRAVAVVRLVNSKRNIIANNLFDGMAAPECNFLHAIYIANYADENIIRDNAFRNGCGDPIRVRDASNYNKIYRNTFVNAGDKAAYSEWFCSRSYNKRCSKSGEECPSVGNEFFDNKLGRGYNGIVIPPTVVYERPVAESCRSGPILSTKNNALAKP
jgi:hypothetical protein